ncbi:hypothetical protein ACFL6D_05050, partial [Spirochaetota bacterium]
MIKAFLPICTLLFFLFTLRYSYPYVASNSDGTLYETIAAAITAATNSITVYVYPGDYSGGIGITNKTNITIISIDSVTNNGSRSNTVINGAGASGIDLLNCSRVTVAGFWITNTTPSDAVYGENSIFTTISNNSINSGDGGAEGIRFLIKSNTIISNEIYGCNDGIYYTTSSCDGSVASYNSIHNNSGFSYVIYDIDGTYTFSRNLLYNNTGSPTINIDTSTFACTLNIYNNTIVSNSGDGIRLRADANSTSGSIYNNIILSNIGWGINDLRSSGDPINTGFNIVYGNSSGNILNADLTIIKTNYESDEPLINTVYPYEILSNTSIAVDNGTNIPGVTDGSIGRGPDIGWIESSFVTYELNDIVFTNPAPNTWIGTNMQTFSGIGGASVSYVFFGTNLNSMGLASGSNAWSTNVDLSPFDGKTNVFYVISSNNDGSYTTNSQTNYMDFTPPVAAVTNPTNADITGYITAYSGTNYDNAAPIAAAFYNINGGTWTSTDETNLNWTITVPPEVGKTVFGFMSSNSAGLVGYAYMTNHINAVKFNTPVSGTWLTNTPYTFSGEASSNTYIYFGTNPASLSYASSDTNWSTNVDLSGYPDITNI